MSATPTSSLQRVLTTLRHQEPDRVPLFLLLTMHGAKELGLTIEAYYARAEHVAMGQLRMADKYRNDCLYTFTYAALEVEAWGGEVVFSEDGPPNAGEPFLRRPEQIRALQPPAIGEAPCLRRVLEATRQLHAQNRGRRPIIGVVMAPFSLPVMQLGFEGYLRLIDEQPALAARLWRLNEEFCVSWANAQLAAGASAICYFNPVASPTIVPRAWFMAHDEPITRRICARVKGPVALHFASGRCLPLVDAVAQTGVAAIGVSALEDLAELKRAAAGRLSLIGNLNGIAMRRWSAAQAEQAVRAAIAAAGPGGGFILADNHGEIPFQVPDETLLAIGESVQRWGAYPLSWAAQEA